MSDATSSSAARVLLVTPGESGERAPEAAQAVRLALLELDPQIEVRIARLTELVPAAARGVVSRAREALSRVIPGLRATEETEVGGEARLAGGLAEIADVAVALYPLAATSLSELRRLGFAPMPLVGLCPEYQPVPTWARGDLDAYAVMGPTARRVLEDVGIDAGRLHVTGLPLVEAWHHAAAERAELRARHQIPAERRVVIVDVEGLDGEDLSTVILQLGLMQDRVDLLFAVDDDARAAEYLRAHARRLGVRARMFGRVERVEEIWAIADVIVSHASHADLGRSAVLGAPMVLLGELPARPQKESLEAALRDGLIRRAPNPMTLGAEVELLLRSDRLEGIRQLLLPLAAPTAPARVAELVLAQYRQKDEILKAALARAQRPAPPPAEPAAPQPAPETASPAAEATPAEPAKPSSPFEEIGGAAAEPARGASTTTQPPSGQSYSSDAWQRVVLAERKADEARQRLDTWERRAQLAREASDTDLIRAASLEADRAREALAKALRELRLIEEGGGRGSEASPGYDRERELEARFARVSVDNELEALKRRMQQGEGGAGDKADR